MSAYTGTLNGTQRMDTTAVDRGDADGDRLGFGLSGDPRRPCRLPAAELGALRFGIAAVTAAIFLAVKRPALPRLDELGALPLAARSSSRSTPPCSFRRADRLRGRRRLNHQCQPDLHRHLAMALLGERFSGLAWLGTVISFAGIGIIAVPTGTACTFNAGALLVLGSALCSAVNTIVQKPLFAAIIH